MDVARPLPKMRFEHAWIVIGVPVFNEKDYIADTISSLKAQEWQDFLAVIADNASDDGTAEVCRQAIGADPRFRYIRHETNRGSINNFNFLLDASGSPYFMWLGAHDLILPDFLSTHVSALEARPSHSLSYSFTQWIDRGGNPLRVTEASRLAGLRGGSFGRYLGSVLRLSESTAINNVIRRSAMGDTRLSIVTGSDQIVLSALLFRGPAHVVPRPLYLRRDLEAKSTRVHRLVGHQSLSAYRSDTVDFYIKSFDRLTAGRRVRGLVRPLLKLLLEWKYNPDFGPRKLVRKLRHALV